MVASIITVGDEILIGQIVDTNSAWLGQQLSELGIKILKIWSVSDEHCEIVSSLGVAVSQSDIVFMTGGLGPTKDDITKKAIADYLGVPLFFHDETFARIKRMFERTGKVLSQNHHDQCLMPQGVEILRNSMGTAPGMLFHHDQKMIISMPGVPFEMKAIMTEVVIPMLGQKIDTAIVHQTILTAGVGETHLENQLTGIIETFPPYIKIAYLPALSQVRLRLSASGNDKLTLQQEVNFYTQQIMNRLGEVVYGLGDMTLEKEIQRLCLSKNLSLGLAESCTGGGLAAKIVSIPGSSEYFLGGIVSYSNDVKMNLLQVKQATLDTFGAVSEQTVIEMVDGAIHALAVDIAVSISGIAGPDGGTPEKPVGTIWICVGSKTNKVTTLVRAGKDRSKNIEIAINQAMDALRKFVLHYE